MGWRSTKARRTSACERPVSLAAVAMRCPSEGDSMVPGQMAFARMPL